MVGMKKRYLPSYIDELCFSGHKMAFVSGPRQVGKTTLITRDREPWLPVEVKLSDSTPSRNWRKFLHFLPCQRALQLVNCTVKKKSHDYGDTKLLVADAAEVLPLLV